MSLRTLTSSATPPRPEIANPSVLAAARTTKPSRILVADDSTFMRRVLTQALRDAGFDVVGRPPTATRRSSSTASCAPTP